MRIFAAFFLALLTPSFVLAQSNAPDFTKFSTSKWEVICSDNDPYQPKMRVGVNMQSGYIETLADNVLARKYAEYVRDRSFTYCNDELKKGKVASVAKLHSISIEVPGTTSTANLQTGGTITFYLGPRNGDAFTAQTETQFTNSVGDYLASVNRQRAQQLAANQAAEAQRQADEARVRRKKAFRDKFLTDHSLAEFMPSQTLKTNPFAVKGKKVAIVTTFDRMIGDGEAIFDGIVVRGVPNTMFQEPRWTILAIEVDGMRQIPALGNISAPIATFLASYLCSSSRCSEVMD